LDKFADFIDQNLAILVTILLDCPGGCLLAEMLC